ncbi:MAG: DMT family transporter [Pseudomonadota bacterium]
MTWFVFCAVLAAALLHAVWNAIVKTGTDKQSAMLTMAVGQSVIGLCLIPFVTTPNAETLMWVIASGVIHMVYQLFLGFAYERGDLSRVYPIARGAAPLLVLGVSLAFALDPLTGLDKTGIIVLVVGIILMAQGVFSSGEDRQLIPLALGSAVATAGYSVVDGLGARVMGDPFAYTAWLLMFAAVFYVPAIIALKGTAIVRVPLRQYGQGLIAGTASFSAYAIVVWAMTQAPIAQVTALRETSILFAVFLGWFWFGDRMTRGKILAGMLIVAGVVLSRV